MLIVVGAVVIGGYRGQRAATKNNIPLPTLDDKVSYQYHENIYHKLGTYYYSSNNFVQKHTLTTTTQYG